MTVNLYYPNVDPELYINETIEIEEYVVDKMKARFLHECENDEELGNELDKILVDLDCSKILNCGKIMSTNTPNYNRTLSLYSYYYNQLNSDIVKQNYLDKLENLMIDNILFDRKYEKEHKSDNTNKSNKSKRKVNKERKKKLPLWIRQESKDLFTNETTYIYTNTKTNEIIKSSNPDLIEEQLNPKKKRKSKASLNIASKVAFRFKI